MLRIPLFIISAVNIAAGAVVAGLYVSARGGGGVPVIVLFIGLALFVQGAYTVGYLRGWWSRSGGRATQLLVAGESTALLVGALGTLQGILYNLHPRNGDQEFGPLMAATLFATHAVVGLVYAARNERFAARGGT